MEEFDLVFILAVIFFASFVRSAFGFGESLIAVPLLALKLPIEIAVPLSVLVSITIAGVIVIQDWQKIHYRSAGWLVFFSALGIPIGLWLLTEGSEQLVKGGLGLIIILFSMYALSGRFNLKLKSDIKIWLFGCGFSSGILGGAYGLNGPPLVIYGALRQWSAQHFRATLQGYFLPASMLGMLGYWYKGLWVPEVTKLYLISLPFFLIAVFLGKKLNQQLSDQRFLNLIYAGLIVIGLILLFDALI